jgi:hypothetical protein
MASPPPSEAYVVSITCFYCGTADGPFEDDHVVPRSRGGPDSPLNLIKACKGCNRAKRDLLPSEWLDIVPERVAAIERRVSDAIGSKIRSRRDWKPNRAKVDAMPKSSARTPGYELLRTKVAVCLEYDKRMCRAPAEWEIWSDIDGSWGALCARCVEFYSYMSRRLLDERRGLLHVLVQLRDGTLKSDGETALLALSRAGGVSIKEYLDFACTMVTADAVVRASLRAAFPLLRLEVWELADSVSAPEKPTVQP